MSRTVDNAAKPIVDAVTKFGKELSIVPARGRPGLTITMSGGGKFPAALAGHFTSYPEAEEAIATYLLSIRKRKRD